VNNRQRVSGEARAQFPVRVRDLSKGGADLVLNTAVEPGTVHEFMIDLAGEPFLAKARIVRCRPLEKGAGHNVGVEFVQVDARDQARLEQYLAARLPRRAG
jgi:c-di-GMP-binding flagellar brake protein YcgR